jgi:alanine dehydrogenase
MPEGSVRPVASRESAEITAEAPRRRRRLVGRVMMVGGVLAAGIAAGTLWLNGGGVVSTDNA